MTFIRLCRSRYSPKDATGAKLYVGRWNNPGYGMLYASSTLALACLEVLVHIRNVGLIPPDYVYCEVEVPEVLVTPWNLTGEAALGKIESPVLSREFGDQWFMSTMPEFQSLVKSREELLPPDSNLPILLDESALFARRQRDPSLRRSPQSKPFPP
jgi:hypothetical protein